MSGKQSFKCKRFWSGETAMNVADELGVAPSKLPADAKERCYLYFVTSVTNSLSPIAGSKITQQQVEAFIAEGMDVTIVPDA